MHTILQLPFKLMTLTGIWMPKEFTSQYEKQGWTLYSIASITLMAIQSLTLSITLILSENSEQFFETLFIVPTGLQNLQKIYVVVAHRKKLMDLEKMFSNDYCIPRNVEELLIQRKYDENIRILTLSCIILMNLTVANLIASPLFDAYFTTMNTRTLPMRIWLPYKMDLNIIFWLTFIQQSVGVIFVGYCIISTTLMINGFMYHVCCQFRILSCRFKKLPQVIDYFRSLKKPYNVIYQYERRAIKQNVQHHLCIFRIAENINDTFKSVIFQQFCISSIVVSASIFQLSTRQEIDMEFFMVLFYLICVLVDFYIYSWFGNQLMLESLNFQRSIYEIDWTTLSTNAGKDLVFIMMRASKPILMYCGHFVVLSLESYVGILKVSYSVLNLFRRSK